MVGKRRLEEKREHYLIEQYIKAITTQKRKEDGTLEDENIFCNSIFNSNNNKKKVKKSSEDQSFKSKEEEDSEMKQ